MFSSCVYSSWDGLLHTLYPKQYCPPTESRILILLTAKEKNLELRSMNVPDLALEMAKLVTGGVPASFHKAKKDAKKEQVLQQWFQQVLIPSYETEGGGGLKQLSAEKPPKKGEKSTEPTPSAKKLDTLESLQGHKPEVLPGVVEETPELMARILILGQNWADLVMAGEKCIELRKTRISSCKQPEMMYLGVKDTIFARCLVCPGVKIENEEQFNMLRNGHRWEDEKLPYGFPFMGHALLQVQALKPVEFQRVWGTIGRALYRPPGFVGLPEDGEEEGKGSSGSKVAEEDAQDKGEATSSKGNVAKKKGSQKEKTGKNTTKTKQNQIKCLPPSALEGQTVETVEPTEHLQPSSQRLEAKQKQLQRKRDADKADVHISGGALAHLNNLAFPRGPSKTAAYLLGEVGKKKSVSVKSLWIPRWEAQGEMEKWTVNEADLKKWAKTFRPALAVVGLCLVVPDQDTPEVSALMVFDQILKEASPKELIFGLVGKDKYCKMYHIVEDVAQELHLEVHWVGDASLYTAHVVAQELEVFEKVKEEAKASIEKQGLCQSVRAKKKQQNEKRKPPQEGSEETRVTAEVSLRKIAEQLQNLAIFLLENLQNFNQERDASIQSKYAECLAAYPLAQLELSKVTPKSSMCPESVQEAGQRMATVLQLKGTLELRLAKRQMNQSHTYDGCKYLKRSVTSQYSSASTRRSKRSRTASSLSTPASEKGDSAPTEEEN